MIRLFQTWMVLLLFTSCVPNEDATQREVRQMQQIFIGTYTGEGSDGIYTAWFDPANGTLSDLQLAIQTPNPSFLTRSGKWLYAVNEMVPGQETGRITAFTAGEDSTLHEHGHVDSKGAYPCYISLSANQENLLVANYGGGSVLNVLLRDQEDNPLGQSWLSEHTGSGPDSSRQEAPHAHSIRQMPGTRVVLSADLGADKVYQYILENDRLVLTDSLGMAPGAGPRHLDFHPSLPIAYVINELNSTITVFSYNESANSFKKEQIISTLPEGYEGESYCADIHVHPGGKWLYGSNRGHDSIVSYRIGEDGLLEMTGHFTEDITWPRNFALSPDGRHLLIGSERGNRITVAEVDSASGRLTATPHQLEISKPVCILF